MRKFVMAVTAFVFALSLVSVGSVAFAGDSVKAKGKLVSMDAKTGDIVFCPSGTEDKVNIKMEDPGDLKGLKEGDAVMVQYAPGDTNMGERIKKDRSITVPVGC